MVLILVVTGLDSFAVLYLIIQIENIKMQKSCFMFKASSSRVYWFTGYTIAGASAY